MCSEDCYFKGRLTRKIKRAKFILCSHDKFNWRFEIAIYSPTKKGDASFFIFGFLDFKLVPIDSALNSGSENPDNYISNIRTWYREQQPHSKNWVKVFLKCPLPPIAVKLESAGTNFFYIKLTRNCVGKICQILIPNVWPRHVSYQK